jgi:Helix-loop-helix DNA-binding domain
LVFTFLYLNLQRRNQDPCVLDRERAALEACLHVLASLRSSLNNSSKALATSMDPAAKSPGDNRDNAGGAAMKRSATDDESSAEDGASSPERVGSDRQDATAMSRSERKRHREKKRRSDVNRGFDDLMNLLIEVDPEVRAEADERSRRGLWKGSLGAQDDNLLSRVDLISRTVSVLRRIHNENEERKAFINQLVLQREALRADIISGSNEVRFTAMNTAQRPWGLRFLHLQSLLTRPPCEGIEVGIHAFQQPSVSWSTRPHNNIITIVRIEPADVFVASLQYESCDGSFVTQPSASNRTISAATDLGELTRPQTPAASCDGGFRATTSLAILGHSGAALSSANIAGAEPTA